MADLYRDPQLDALISELNRDGAERPELAVEPAEGDDLAAELLSAPRRRAVDPDSGLARLLGLLGDRGASDLLLVAGVPAVLRVNGRLTGAGAEALDSEEILGLFAPYL